MRCLSLTQPWAMLVCIGAKRIETRSWGTSYRGPLAIHASKGFPKWAREFTLDPVCYSAVKARYCQRDIENRAKGFPAYPLGVVLATCRLVEVKLIVDSREALGPCADAARMLPPREPEFSFGDYTPGRYAWMLEDVKPLPEPIPAKGALGLWEWTR